MKARISEFNYPSSIHRCQHIKVNGIQCGSPSLKSRKLCHFHQRWQVGRIQINANRARRARFSIEMPVLEDANSIQVTLMQAMRLLLTNQIDHKTAALLFYGLQTASTNLRHTEFEPRPERVLIDPSRVPDTFLGDNAWYKEEFEAAEDEPEEDVPDEENEGQQNRAQAKARTENPITNDLENNDLKTNDRLTNDRLKNDPTTSDQAVAKAKAEISAHIQKSFDLHAIAGQKFPPHRAQSTSQGKKRPQLAEIAGSAQLVAARASPPH